ncbi:MAG: hypothetical protein ACTSPD_02070 [Promethearchaeota archaeon]
MIVNDLDRKILRASFSKTITINDDGENAIYIFPNTKSFIAGINKKKNAEQLHKILKRIK